MKCKQCNFLHNQWCERVWNSPDEERERDCRYFKQKTNADRIRAMTDEDLADLFRYRGCPPDRLTGKCVKVGVCEACWVDWLKQPVEEKI